MKRFTQLLGFFFALGSLPVIQLFSFPKATQAQTTLVNQCATPGKDGVDDGTLTIVNSYFPGPTTGATLNPGDTSIPVSAINSAGNQTTITPGDLLLVIQMQDADINFTDTAAYGSGNTSNEGSGVTAINSTGLYEYVVALNTVGTSGGNIQIRGTGAGEGLVNSYRQQAADLTAHGQRTYQVVRVPQYTNTTLTGTIRSPGSWDGTSGGIVAIDVSETLTLAGGNIETQDKGFRGGGGTTNTNTYPPDEDEAYRTDGNVPRGGVKGEGIAGTPRYVFDGTTTIDTGIDGYPRLESEDSYTTIGTTEGGSRARGAPGNAGGGGNQHNSGGGGGGNAGGGGTGGDSINSPPISEVPSTGTSKPVGGRGGAALSSTVSRLIMGGGGGAGDANNGVAGSGGLGGGIVIIRAGMITGTGTISAEARDGVLTPTDDGGAGAGAGGTILLLAESGSLANITLNASGGKGGDTNTAQVIPYDFGPGGGGGGGAIFSSIPVGTALVDGGEPGGSFNGQLGTPTVGVTRGATAGEDGTVISNTGSTESPGILPGAECKANLLLVKRITAIGGSTTNPNDSTNLGQFVNDDTTSSPTDDDDHSSWPSNYLIGAIEGGLVKPDETIEYTIYFLSSGSVGLTNVKICDLIPENTTYVLGSGTITFGNNAETSWDDDRNSDEGEYFEPATTILNTEVPGVGQCRSDNDITADLPDTENTNGAIWVEVDKITTPIPSEQAGYIRFRVTINETPIP